MNFLNLLILVYFFCLNAFYFLFILLSLYGQIRYRRLTTYLSFKEIFQFPLIKPISVIAPAFNESSTIVESVRSLLALEYPLFEVIVVNDGSTDDTLEKLIQAFKLKRKNWVFRRVLSTKPVRGIYVSSLDPRLVVIDKENGGKADALNAGINLARYPLFCAVDSDSLLERDSLVKVVRPFIEEPEKTVASGGIIQLSNGCKVKFGQVVEIGIARNWLVRFQIIEYLRAFLGGRTGLSLLRSLLIISGAFGLFRKDVVQSCGGYRCHTVGEDMDLVIRLQAYLRKNKKPYRIVFVPDPICWTEAPETLRSLTRQRNRWHRGLIESLTYSFSLFFNPRYGLTGLLAMPYYTFFEMFGPVIEIAGYTLFLYYTLTNQLNTAFALLFFLLAVIVGILLSSLSVLLAEYSERRYPHLKHILILFAFAWLENLFYRQFLAVVRAGAFLSLLRRKKEWGRMERKGFQKLT
ncbi:MAG: glycosyltransferase family 2 protein [Candidatus Aminicenantes bacterium]|nr:glycosyltransferase family 2 protein [Candidatus Aminicenantes bacterium]